MLLKNLSIFLLILFEVKQSNCQQCSEIAENNRLDCAADKPNDTEVCSQRKCCFTTNNSTNGMNCDKIYFNFNTLSLLKKIVI